MMTLNAHHVLAVPFHQTKEQLMKLAIIPLSIFLMIPHSLLKADGVPSGYSVIDGRVVKDVPMRYMRASSCGRYVSDYECEKRLRRAERRRDRDDNSDTVSRSRCANKTVSAKGAQRPTESWARRTAIEAWGRDVRYDLGETYLSWSNAKNARVICNPSSIGGFQIRCEARGIPCQGQ